MSDVRLHLMGGFDLEVDGEPVGGLQPAVQRLLAFVALAPRGVEREFAALQLWPDATEERARANLRSALWRLRRVPCELVVTTSTRLRLAERVWVDARDGLESTTEAACEPGVAGALPFHALLADLLPDWYDDWLDIERERLRQLSLCALERRAAAALAAGDPSAAIQLGLTAASIDPLRESAHRLVIQAHLAEGNRHDAQRTFEGYRRRAALDALVPSDDLVALIDDRVDAWPAPLATAG